MPTWTRRCCRTSKPLSKKIRPRRGNQWPKDCILPRKSWTEPLRDWQMPSKRSKSTGTNGCNTWKSQSNCGIHSLWVTRNDKQNSERPPNRPRRMRTLPGNPSMSRMRKLYPQRTNQLNQPKPPTKSWISPRRQRPTRKLYRGICRIFSSRPVGAEITVFHALHEQADWRNAQEANCHRHWAQFRRLLQDQPVEGVSSTFQCSSSQSGYRSARAWDAQRSSFFFSLCCPWFVVQVDPRCWSSMQQHPKGWALAARLPAGHTLTCFWPSIRC